MKKTAIFVLALGSALAFSALANPSVHFNSSQIGSAISLSQNAMRDIRLADDTNAVGDSANTSQPMSDNSSASTDPNSASNSAQQQPQSNNDATDQTQSASSTDSTDTD
jgi:Skp family chaperone for outer membrane proteins